jgi:hypothetical protein
MHSLNKIEGEKVILEKEKSILRSVIIMKYDSPLKLCRKIQEVVNTPKLFILSNVLWLSISAFVNFDLILQPVCFYLLNYGIMTKYYCTSDIL